MSTILTNFLVHVTVTGRVRGSKDAGKGGGAGGGGELAPLPFLKGSRGEQKCPFIKYTCLIKNEQALAEVIICVQAERGVTARSEILRLYLLQA